MSEREKQLLATMVYEAVRFSSWAVGEGITPIAGEPAKDPGEFLSDYVTGIDGDDYEGLAEVARDAIGVAPTRQTHQAKGALTDADLRHFAECARAMCEQRCGPLLTISVEGGIKIEKLIAEVERLRAYEVELRRIAEDLGEPNDPFAAWEKLAGRQRSAAMTGEPAAWNDAVDACEDAVEEVLDKCAEDGERTFTAISQRVADAFCLVRKPAAAPQPTAMTDAPADCQDDPSADDRWNAGLDFGQQQLCKYLGVDPDDVTWDAATEELEGDVQAVIGNIMRAKFGEDWGPASIANTESVAALLHLAERLRVSSAEDGPQEQKMVMNRIAYSLAAHAKATPPSSGNADAVRAATIEECAKVLDDAAQDWNRIRDPDMANNARCYAKKIRALSSAPVAGGITGAEIDPFLEKLLAKWEANPGVMVFGTSKTVDVIAAAIRGAVTRNDREGGAS